MRGDPDLEQTLISTRPGSVWERDGEKDRIGLLGLRKSGCWRKDFAKPICHDGTCREGACKASYEEVAFCGSKDDRRRSDVMTWIPAALTTEQELGHIKPRPTRAFADHRHQRSFPDLKTRT